MDEQENREPGKSPDIAGIVDWLWTFFSSTKLALALILITVGMSLIGVFLTNIDIFHSWVFLLSGALLMANIIVCSINRWPGIRLSLRGGEIRQKEDFFTRSAHEELRDISLPAVTASEIAGKAIRMHGYRVRVLNDADAAYIAADKNRYLRLGTYISHLSLVLFVLGYVLGGFLGFRETNFSVAEGSAREIGHNTGLSLQLNSFVDEYYPDSLPKDYRSQVTLYENGQEVKQALIRVNHPLVYKGVRFYQSFFGQAVQVKLSMNGTPLFQGNVTFDSSMQSQGITRYTGIIGLESGLTVRLIESAGTGDPMIPEGQLAADVLMNGKPVARNLIQKNVPLSMGGIDIVYQGDTKFSGFQVSNDPANRLIWISSSLFILGIILVLYFPYRQIWVLFESTKPGNSRILFRGGVSRGPGGASELKKLASDIEQELQKRKSSDSKEAK
jgi:cytochrome c biogenesis protein